MTTVRPAEVLAQAQVSVLESVFIHGEAPLELRYGERVPVLRDEERNAELDWPFDVARLRRWL